ncbi:MAG: EI24 domain-containing protein [Spirochaetes bacterium]|nr:EI24 domain-containing protein [Spirochaetota bacterium]
MANSNFVNPGRTFFKGIKSGFFYVFVSWKFIGKNKGFIKFFIIPFFTNIIILLTFSYISFIKAYPYLYSLLPEGNNIIYTVLKYIAAPLLAGILVLTVVLLYSITGAITSSFFYDLISQKTELIIKGSVKDEKFSIGMIIADMIRTFSNILKILVFLICLNCVLFLLNFIPAAGTVLYSIGTYFSLTFFFGFQFIELIMDRRKMTFGRKLKTAFHYKWTVCGIGSGFLLMTLIPLIGFLTPGAGAVAGTIFYLDSIEPAVSSEKRD